MAKDPGELLDKYNAGLCSEEEKVIVESWYLKLSSAVAEDLDMASVKRTKEAAWKALSANQPVAKKKPLNFWLGAAVLLIMGSIGIFYFSLPKTQPAVIRTAKNNDVAPGGNKAILTLADGSKISLTDASRGEIVKQGGLSIQKTADGKLVYTVVASDKGGKEALSFNTIETPKGGQYQINLPDGTKVWLNSASSLRYPIKFTGDRVVELMGEGYFEVAKQKVKGHISGATNVPFIVKTPGQEVEVLGTHFNINSYKEEEGIKTTLLEGIVRVIPSDVKEKEHSKLLKPGEQALLNEHAIKVQTVDTEAIIAWKNGDFAFKGDNLKSIMNRVARWYDVEVVYKGNFDHLKFGGYISRSKNISEVLNIMESTGKVHFTIDGKKITVLNKK
ncbi:FecR family protein [Pedobacter nyackensis]|uniref:FecR family protein n=1 Tax=Pedobacter nyackensis TaxID=475255 RepID=A0A1W2E1Y7_9SPHI|nr:FecR family protein [Pedobacter nyackensis]SMD03844.1 FecR family protein [Pedobacter nyackensis]